MTGIRFGAAYYHEYQPYHRLDLDLDLMVKAGFNVVRVGESVWSTWEPEEGRFDLEWLRSIVDGAHQRGLGVVIGTPTYAVPPWLRRRYPETAAHRRSGEPIPYGHRQDMDITSPAFRHLAERLVRRIVPAYRDHPAVLGWQVDNEPGNELLHNPAVFDRFVDHLRDRYGSVASLNEAWGLTYWSHRLHDWADLWLPDGNTVPGYDLAWRTFQAGLTTDFIGWQAGIVRELAAPGQFVTTCLALGRPALNPTELAATLDVAAVNIYFAAQDALTMPAVPAGGQYGSPEWLPPQTGPDVLFRQADLGRGLRQGPFLVTETAATSIGESHVNFPAFDGQWRQAAYAFIARGAAMVEYWHWHSLHAGHEVYWGGVLGHDLEPSRCYEELSRLGAELGRVGDRLAGLVPTADVGVVVSPRSSWSLAFQPPLGDNRGRPVADSYGRIVGAFYSGLFRAGLQMDMVTPAQLGTDAVDMVRRWPVLVAAALYICSDDEIELLQRYVDAGGHLVVGPRSCYADPEARPRAQRMPAGLVAAAGAGYSEFTNVRAPIAVSGRLSGRATGWADAIVAESAEVLAAYEHPHLSPYAAVTTTRTGPGRVTQVGTVPDLDLATDLGRWIRATLPATRPTARTWASLPDPVTMATGRAPDGTDIGFVFNWSWQPQRVRAEDAVVDLLTGASVEAGADLRLGPWDVCLVAMGVRQP